MSSRGYRSGSLSTTRSGIVISVSVCSVYCSEVNSYHFSTRQIRFLFSFRLCFSFVHSQGKVSKPGNSKNYENLGLCKRYIYLCMTQLANCSSYSYDDCSNEDHRRKTQVTFVAFCRRTISLFSKLPINFIFPIFCFLFDLHNKNIYSNAKVSIVKYKNIYSNAKVSIVLRFRH